MKALTLIFKNCHILLVLVVSLLKYNALILLHIKNDSLNVTMNVNNETIKTYSLTYYLTYLILHRIVPPNMKYDKSLGPKY